MLSTPDGVLIDKDDNFECYLKIFDKTEYVKISYLFLMEISLSIAE